MRKTPLPIYVLLYIHGKLVYGDHSQLRCFDYLKGWIPAKTGEAKMVVKTLNAETVYYFKQKI